MSIYPSPDKLDSQESKYALVILAAKRARQIKDGARPLIEKRSVNPLTAALEEIAEGAVIARVVDDATVTAQRAALKPTTPSLEDIIAAGPVLTLEPDPDSPAGQLAALRAVDTDNEDDDLSEDDRDDVLTPVDVFAEDAPGLLSEMDDEDDLIPSIEDEDE